MKYVAWGITFVLAYIIAFPWIIIAGFMVLRIITTLASVTHYQEYFHYVLSLVGQP